MDRHFNYEAPRALVVEMDCASFLCQSQGQGGTLPEIDWGNPESVMSLMQGNI